MKILRPLVYSILLACFAHVANATEATISDKKIISPSNTETPSVMDMSIAPALNINKLQSGKETLNVGHYKQLPPFYFTNSDSHQPGFGHEIFSEVAKQAGIKNINFIGFDNATNLNQLLKAGKIDVIANSWDLPGMRKQFLLTTPYYSKGGLSFLYFKNSGPFRSLDDLKNHSIGVLKDGYAARYWLPAHNIAPSSSVKTYSSINDLMTALNEGEVDLAIVYYPLARYAQTQANNKLEVLLIQPINDVYAVRKQDTALQQILNQAINSLSAQGTLEKITKSYLDST